MTKNRITVQKTFDDIREITFSGDYDSDEVIFYVSGNKTNYFFGYGKDENEAKNNIVAKGLTRHVSTEVSKISFTGVYLGIFADGDGSGAAHVSYFNYEGKD